MELVPPNRKNDTGPTQDTKDPVAKKITVFCVLGGTSKKTPCILQAVSKPFVHIPFVTFTLCASVYLTHIIDHAFRNVHFEKNVLVWYSAVQCAVPCCCAK